jgi:hypothetical protein
MMVMTSATTAAKIGRAIKKWLKRMGFGLYLGGRARMANGQWWPSPIRHSP